MNLITVQRLLQDYVDQRTDAIDAELANATYGLSALDTGIDGIRSQTDHATYGLSALKTETDNIDSTLANATYGLAQLRTELDNIDTALAGVQNNTRFTAAVPVLMQRPSSGSLAQRIAICLYDTEGNMEDPDGNMAVNILNTAGSSLDANLYDNSGLTTAATTTAETGLTGKVMKKVGTQVGHYELFYSVSSTAAEEILILNFNYKEGGKFRIHSRSSQVSDATNDLNSIRNVVENATYGNSALKTETDNIDAELANATYGLSALKTKLNDNGTAIAAIQTDLGDPSARTNLVTIVAMLGNPDTAGETIYKRTTDIITETTNIDNELANATYGLSKLRTELDNVDTAVGTSADAASETGSVFAMLKHIEAHLDTIESGQVSTLSWSPVAGLADGTGKLTSGDTEFTDDGTTNSTTYTAVKSYTIDDPATGTKSVTVADLDFTIKASVNAGSGNVKVMAGTADITDAVAIGTSESTIYRSGKLKGGQIATLPVTIAVMGNVNATTTTLTVKVSSKTAGTIVYTV